MSTEHHVPDLIDQAAERVGSVWPLHSFVTANPLAGFEDRPFHEALRAGERRFGGDGYPSVTVFRRAWADGRIDPESLRARLAEHGHPTDPETALELMREAAAGPGTGGDPTPATDAVDRWVTTWLARFLAEGTAHWPMPNREAGFFAAVRRLARHDRELPHRERLADLPDDPAAAIETLLADVPSGEWPRIIDYQLAALPGWTGFLNRRIEADDAWQDAHPITLAGYLAIRLAVADLLDAPIAPPDDWEMGPADAGPSAGAAGEGDGKPLQAVWLSAWEATYREALVTAVSDASGAAAPRDDERPDAQLVFCIDTRSEIIRRHVEAVGDYETHGYAGFFGIPMRYEGYDSSVAVDACPPIVDAEHRIADQPIDDADSDRRRHDRWRGLRDAADAVVDSLATNAATAFSFVESAGIGYGGALAVRTLLPARVADLLTAIDERVPDPEAFTEPALDTDPETSGDLLAGLTLEDQVEYAATAVELMGWEQFSRVVCFVGHASQTANNPFDASLDCGACAGNPGGPSARVLAAICNDGRVRDGLRDRGIEIPPETVFVAGEHNTTTDEVELYTAAVPETHEAAVADVETDLERARERAAAERAGDMGADPAAGVRETERRAADWAETRPEWGLAGNAGFVVGPRSLTDGLDLDGRAFLHSYDWRTDPDGTALEAILTGPLVVTQWINTQYYCATVDTAAYGSGSKVTQNPVGNLGVYQGNGGDLQTGLPLQSVRRAPDDPYHQPLRLSTVIHAPLERVTDVLAETSAVTALLDNEWLSLTVVDPQQDHRAFHYAGELEWTAESEDLADPRPDPAVPTISDG